MITANNLKTALKADKKCACRLGNWLFLIAGTIAVATKNGYEYAFPKWVNQEFFMNELPYTNKQLPNWRMPSNYKGFDIGFIGFNVPDNISLDGQFGSEKYFEHCEDLIRHYFTMKKLCEPIKGKIIINYREYEPQDYVNGFARLDRSYFQEALKRLPSKDIVVVTNDIEAAKKTLKEDYEYIDVSPIVDFYLVANADYLIMANSTFSWWGAWLSKAKTIAPSKWFAGKWKDCPTKDLYCKEWEII